MSILRKYSIHFSMVGPFQEDVNTDQFLLISRGFTMQHKTNIIICVGLLLNCICLPIISAADFCPPLDPPSGSVVTVSTEADLRFAATKSESGTTILVSPGNYSMKNFIHVVNDSIAIRGKTGNRDDIILDFGGMIDGHFGILVEGDDFTIADLTIRNAKNHGVSIQGVDRPILYNLKIQDIGDQLVKVNPIGDGSEDGLLACSCLEYTTSAPDTYTNGISAHDSHRWIVRDNQWKRIRTNDDNVTIPAILFWSGSSDTVVKRNLLVDCSRGIAFGNPSHSGVDHLGGKVFNNVIYSTLKHDVAIEMVRAEGWLVAHNTAILLNPISGLTWGMEARFAESVGTFANNLTNMNIFGNRNGANTSLSNNIMNAQLSLFSDAANGDFHLNETADEAVNQGIFLADVTTDFDGEMRDSKPDIGAYELPQSQLSPDPPTNLRIVE
ncbi:MAG: hypothetical protein ACLFQY_17380 [Desulfococcaceae bacterium]